MDDIESINGWTTATKHRYKNDWVFVIPIEGLVS